MEKNSGNILVLTIATFYAHVPFSFGYAGDSVIVNPFQASALLELNSELNTCVTATWSINVLNGSESSTLINVLQVVIG